MAEVRFRDEILLGDCLELFPKVPDNSVQTIHTSPPYNIERGYEGYDDKLGQKEYLDFIEKVLSECMRTLVPGGALFWQTGYTTEGDEFITPLDHLTFGLFQKQGFLLRDRIIWRYWGGMAFKSKFTNKHETILWWVKPPRGKRTPKFNVFPVREATKFYDSRNNLFGRNPGNVWEVDRVAFGSNGQTSHIAVFPEEIPDRIVLSTTDKEDLVLDPFSGSGTVCKVAKGRGRNFLGFEISPLYHHESVYRLSFQAKGELLSVLSEILKEHVLHAGETKKVSTIVEKVGALLSPLSLEPYEKIITKHYLNALCDGREDVVRKSDKISLWKQLDEMLPPNGSADLGKDPFGLISVVDKAFLRAYKLHKEYSSAMRFHGAARWIIQLRNAIGSNTQSGWNKLLDSLVKSETGTYRFENEMISLVDSGNRIRQEILEQPASRASHNEKTASTLFT